MKNLKIIAEIGSNWNGNEKIGKKLIKSAKLAGADYVKFQMWRASDLYRTTNRYWNEMKKAEFTPQMAKKFKEYADELEIDCFWSVFYPEAVDTLEELNVKLYKIASITSAQKHKFSAETLERLSQTKKPVIISMGLGGNRNKIGKILYNNKKYFLYCVAKYPTRVNEISFTKMDKFDGFSDHTEGILAPIIFALKNRNTKSLKFFEKHVSIQESKGPDKPFSLDMYDLKKYIEEISQIDLLHPLIL